MRNKVRTILKEWLQSKDDIVFTDDIAIEEVTDEIVEACRQKCTIPVVSGSLPLASAEFIKWLMDDKHDYVYVNGEFIEQWTNVEFTISELYDQWSMERRQANDR